MVVFQKQKPMRRVLIALAPIVAFSIFLYGYRGALLMALCLVVGTLVEWLFERRRSGKVSEAVLVSCVLYALSLPPKTPLWIAAVGIAFGVFMAKEVYGGFGRNIFNPAIAARLFVYVAFATVLNRGYMAPGGLGMPHVDVMASATPLALMRSRPDAVLGLRELVLGFRPGALGETPLILITLGGLYLMATKTASWRIVLSLLVSAAALAAGLYYGKAAGALPPESLLAGSLFFVAMFMATDPVTAPKKAPAQFIYGALIGVVIVLTRTFSAFPEGTSFGVFIGNTFAAFLDIIVTKNKGAKA